MPRRTKEELKLEFERLSSIFQVIIDFERTETPEQAADLDLVRTKEDMLGWVASGKATLSEITRGTQMAINDFQMGLSDFNEETHYLMSPFERGPDRNKFLAFYRERTGRDFYLDVTDSKQTARSVVRRGNIKTEVEYYVVVELVNDVSQSVLSQTELVQVGDMIVEFEALQ